MKPAGDVRQQVGPDRRDQGQLQGSGEWVPVDIAKLDDRVGLLQQVAGPRDDLFAGVGQADPLRLALDELHAEVFLELADLRRSVGWLT